MKRALELTVGLSCALLAAGAVAGSITVAPTRIELSARRPIATLEVSNDGADRVTVQLERLAWSQPEGSDRYEPTSSLIATPTVFELGPHASQTLRIAMRDGKVGSLEQAYRLYASEVPDAHPMDGSGLKMALRIGVPVFVGGGAAPAQLSAEILKSADGARALRIRNGGGRFARALGIDLLTPSGTVLWQTKNSAYLLAGGEHVWPLELAAGTLTDDTHVQLSVTTESGVQRVDARFGP